MKDTMLRKFRQEGFVFALLLVVMLAAVGCANRSSEPASGEDGIAATPTEAVSTLTPTEAIATLAPTEAVPTLAPTEAIPTLAPTEAVATFAPTEIPVTDKVEGAVAKEDGLYAVAEATGKRVIMEFYEGLDSINVYSVEASNPTYYIGRENYEENIDFLKKNKDVNGGTVYLGIPLYLPEKVAEGTCYLKISDESVAKIENNELIGLKQGVFTLYSYDAGMNLIEEKKYVCTTYNDSKENKESHMTIKAKHGNSTISFINARDFDYWKDAVHTIMDMSYMLQARHFCYDFAKEPEFGGVSNISDKLQHWMWTAAPETIFEMSGGVCIEVAQLACAMLAGDYEDWGVILIDGEQGHILNWFFEDGDYYLFDFTQVISDNTWGRLERQYDEYWDYSDYVVKCANIDEIKEYMVTEKVDTELNYLIYMYSCKGHDYIACNLNTAMSDSFAANRGEFDEIVLGFQDVVMEDLVVLYQKDICNVVLKSYTAEELNISIPHGIYNDTKKLVYRFMY